MILLNCRLVFGTKRWLSIEDVSQMCQIWCLVLILACNWKLDQSLHHLLKFYSPKTSFPLRLSLISPQARQMILHGNKEFSTQQILHFCNGRGLQHSSNVPNKGISFWTAHVRSILASIFQIAPAGANDFKYKLAFKAVRLTNSQQRTGAIQTKKVQTYVCIGLGTFNPLFLLVEPHQTTMSCCSGG